MISKKPEWNDSFYLTAYQLAKMGEYDKGIAEGLGVSTKQLRAWKKSKPELKRAISMGREAKAKTITLHEDNGDREPDQLTDPERLFCECFVETLNLTESAYASGLASKDTTRAAAGVRGHGLLKKQRVQTEVARLFEEKRIRNGIDTDRVVRELAHIAYSNLGDLFNEDGTMKSVTEIDEGALRAISSLEVEAIQDKEGNILGVRTKVKQWDKLKALELYAKISGLIPVASFQQDNRTQHVHLESNPFGHLTDEQLIEAKRTLEELKGGGDDSEG